MKKEFMFKSETVAKEFEKLSEKELQAMTQGFLTDYGIPNTAFGKRVDLDPKSISWWVDGKKPLGTRSLKRIFVYLVDFYPKWKDYVGNNQSTTSAPTKND